MSSSEYIPSVSLSQQDGGMTIQAFAEQQGITLQMMRYYIKTGRVIGARQDSRSKKWTIYPPAKLVDKSGDAMRRREVLPYGLKQAHQPLAAALAVPLGTSPHGLSAGLSLPVQETRGGLSSPSSAKPVLTLPDSNVYRCSETRSVLDVLREAAARQYREGVHYLRLEGREISQLYAALGCERSRIRKLVGKGLVDVGNLRASDSVWQKLQAMCQQGKLL